jgi:hypothetical protein
MEVFMKKRFVNPVRQGTILDRKNNRTISADDLFYILPWLRNDERKDAKKILQVSMYDPVKSLKVTVNGRKLHFNYSKNHKLTSIHIPNWEASREQVLGEKGPNIVAYTFSESILLPTELLQAYIKTCQKQRNLINKE